MKTIGLIGGISWESTVKYYEGLNLGIREALGGFYSCPMTMISVDFQEIEKRQRTGAWDELTEMMIGYGKRLEAAGAEGILICANTMHRMAGEVETAVGLPVIHIGDATGKAVVDKQLKKVGLLGTMYTMTQPFLKQYLCDRYDLEVIVPEGDDLTTVHRIIFEELVQGKVLSDSKASYLTIIDRLIGQGCQGIILGCTEIPMLIGQEDCAVPVFDTTKLHIATGVDFVLGKEA